MDPGKSQRVWRYELILGLLLLLALPLANPLLRGDGFGYFAYLRSAVIDGDLQFENEYRRANPELLENIASHGDFGHPHFRTVTGHYVNQYAVGPAVLWAPFYLLAHWAVLAARALGAAVTADGFSPPYRWAVALGTAIYGSLGVWLCFLVGRRLFSRAAAFGAALAIWWGASLPVYLYFQPSMSHAHSFFLLALYLYLLLRLREDPPPGRGYALGLGLTAGLSLSVYYVNLIPVAGLSAFLMSEEIPRRRLFNAGGGRGWLWLGGALLGLLPHLLVKQVIYGAFWRTGYEWQPWYFTQPKVFAVLFSPLHGLWSWTPLLLPAVLGWLLLYRRQRRLALAGGATFLLFLYVIASFDTWHGISSYGNRFFISLYPLFFLGLGAMLSRLSGRGLRLAAAALILLIAWNVGFMVQWGTGLVPKRTPVSFGRMARQQFTAVPAMASRKLYGYFYQRSKTVEELQTLDRQKSEEQRQQGQGRGYL